MFKQDITEVEKSMETPKMLWFGCEVGREPGAPAEPGQRLYEDPSCIMIIVIIIIIMISSSSSNIFITM